MFDSKTSYIKIIILYYFIIVVWFQVLKGFIEYMGNFELLCLFEQMFFSLLRGISCDCYLCIHYTLLFKPHMLTWSVKKIVHVENVLKLKIYHYLYLILYSLILIFLLSYILISTKDRKVFFELISQMVTIDSFHRKSFNFYF